MLLDRCRHSYICSRERFYFVGSEKRNSASFFLLKMATNPDFSVEQCTVVWTASISSNSSPPFVFQKHKYNFFLSYYTDTSDDYRDYPLSMYMHEKDISPPVRVTVSIADGKGCFKTFPTKTIKSTNVLIWLMSKWTLQDIIPDFDDRFMRFKIVLQDGSAEDAIDDKTFQTPPYLDSHFTLEALSQDLAKLLDEGTTHDVEITCGERTFKAHKDVLSVRSPVFSAMLQSDMLEGKTGRVKIEDTEADVFRHFLVYLYGGKLPDLMTVDTAKRLYQAGDKYAVGKLKEQCASFLAENLAKENVCWVLVMADQRNDSDLKESAIAHMLSEELPNREELLWKDFCDTHPRLANEVLNRFLRMLRHK